MAPNATSASVNLPAVPIGKRLVIDTVSFCLEPDAPNGIAFALIELTTAGTPISFYVPMTRMTDSLSGQETWIGTFTGSLYADPGTQVSMVGYRTALGVASSFNYAISGHYVQP